MRVCQFRHIRDCEIYINALVRKSQAFFEKYFKKINLHGY